VGISDKLVEIIFVTWSFVNDYIGYPKLFMGCQRAFEKPAPRTVNNFAAHRAATGSDWPLGLICGIGFLWFPAPAGQAC